MYMSYDKNIKRGDYVRVRRSVVGEWETGIDLEVTLDTNYESIERYHVKYYSFLKNKEDVQWANHVEVLSSHESGGSC